MLSCYNIKDCIGSAGNIGKRGIGGKSPGTSDTILLS